MNRCINVTTHSGSKRHGPRENCITSRNQNKSTRTERATQLNGPRIENKASLGLGNAFEKLADRHFTGAPDVPHEMTKPIKKRALYTCPTLGNASVGGHVRAKCTVIKHSGKDCGSRCGHLDSIPQGLLAGCARAWLAICSASNYEERSPFPCKQAVAIKNPIQGTTTFLSKGEHSTERDRSQGHAFQ